MLCGGAGPRWGRICVMSAIYLVLWNCLASEARADKLVLDSTDSNHKTGYILGNISKVAVLGLLRNASRALKAFEPLALERAEIERRLAEQSQWTDPCPSTGEEKCQSRMASMCALDDGGSDHALANDQPDLEQQQPAAVSSSHETLVAVRSKGRKDKATKIEWSDSRPMQILSDLWDILHGEDAFWACLMENAENEDFWVSYENVEASVKKYALTIDDGAVITDISGEFDFDKMEQDIEKQFEAHPKGFDDINDYLDYFLEGVDFSGEPGTIVTETETRVLTKDQHSQDASIIIDTVHESGELPGMGQHQMVNDGTPPDDSPELLNDQHRLPMVKWDRDSSCSAFARNGTLYCAQQEDICAWKKEASSIVRDYEWVHNLVSSMKFGDKERDTKKLKVTRVEFDPAYHDENSNWLFKNCSITFTLARQLNAQGSQEKTRKNMSVVLEEPFNVFHSHGYLPAQPLVDHIIRTSFNLTKEVFWKGWEPDV